jgi:hypothetical protein
MQVRSLRRIVIEDERGVRLTVTDFAPAGIAQVWLACSFVMVVPNAAGCAELPL